MKTFAKYIPNVFLVKSDEKLEKNTIASVETRYSGEVNVIIFNLIYEKEGFFFYSYVREDGFDRKAYFERKAEKKLYTAQNLEKKSEDFHKKSNKDSDFLSLCEPVKVGHHSEARHRKILEQAQNNARNSFALTDEAEERREKAEYYEKQALKIDLSMPESVEYFKNKSEKLTEIHAKMKKGEIEQTHSYSLVYAKKYANEAKKNYEIALKLWS